MLRLFSSTAVRSLSRRPFSSTAVKEPGVVGLTEDPNARQTLVALYNQTLESLKQFPEDAAYRVNVEKITNYRLQVVNSTDDTHKIEHTLNVGPMPEIIEQAQDELELIPHMAQWKPWVTAGKKPAVIEVIQ